jgi:hypothetical protein
MIPVADDFRVNERRVMVRLSDAICVTRLDRLRRAGKPIHPHFR